MKYFFPLIIFFLLLFSTQQSLAFVVQGNSSSTSTSTTTIEGSGSVTTHIQSDVNGNMKTLDSNSPGTYTLDNSSDDVTTEPLPSSEQAIPTVTPTLSLTPTPTPKITYHAPHTLSVFSKLQTFFHTTIQKLLSAFHI